MRYFCTYFDRNYLAKGLTLINSLRKWHDNRITIYVVCMDELSRLLLEKLAIPGVVLVPLHSIEAGDQQLLNTRNDRTAVEYLWTSTPTIILRLLERFSEIDILTYVDADMFFYASSEPVFQELGAASVLIHEHRFPQHLAHLEQFGRFNVGLLVFKRDATSFQVLQWWRERCLEWCKATLEDGKYGDQKYLDSWPQLFSGIVATQNIGVGTAPWNHSQYKFGFKDRRVYVNESPLIINHFHAFHIVNTDIIVPVAIPDYVNPVSYYTTVVPQYVEALDRSIQQIRQIDPEFLFGLTKENHQFTTETGFIVRNSQLEQIRAIAPSLPFFAVSEEWSLSPGTRTLSDLQTTDRIGA